MTSTVASQTPVSDDEICGDVDMKTVEPSSVAPGEVSTTFTPINGQEDTAPTHEEGEAGLEKDTANLDVNSKTSPKKRAASNAPTGAKTSPTKKRAAAKLKRLAPKPADQSDGAADVEEPMTPAKKPAPKAKAKKAAATKEIKSEPEVDADELAGSGAETTPAPTPAKKTPKPKAAKKAPAAKSIKKEATPEEQHDNDGAPASNSASPTGSPTKVNNGDTLANGKPRKRQAPKNDTRTKAMIPKSYDEASEVDRMLYDLKEAGMGWKTICAKYEEMTGDEVGMKSLGSRYTRMKANMMRLKPGHASLLLQTIARIEHDFEVHKWTTIATALRTETDENYTTEFLKKQVKELEANGGMAGLSEEEKEAGERVGKGDEDAEDGEGEVEGDEEVGLVKSEEVVEEGGDEMEMEAV